jgi:hypothetical protein
MVQKRVEGFLFAPDLFFDSRSSKIISLAARQTGAETQFSVRDLGSPLLCPDQRQDQQAGARRSGQGWAAVFGGPPKAWP